MEGNWLNNLWIVFVAMSVLAPMLQRWLLARGRRALIRQLERQRQSRVITLIHRQEALSFLGIPFARYMDIEDSEQVLRAVRLTPPGMPIDIILHTPGGLVLAAEQIAMALQRHKGKVTVLVPHYAMSGGTMLALAADDICMDENAVLGPVDPQLGHYPAASVLRVLEQKPIAEIADDTLILADIAAKALSQVRTFLAGLLAERLPEGRALEVATMLSDGRWTHDYPISAAAVRELGLNVTTSLPAEVYTLMNLYPQPQGRRPTVEYIPNPYDTRPARTPLR